MNRVLLVTLPRHDKGTEYLFAWSKPVLDAAKEKGWTVHLSEGKNANPFEVHSRLTKHKIDFVFFNGHGNESQMFGHDFEVIMDEESAGLLKNRVVFARACNCISKLGETAVQNGCSAFVGYSNKFWFPRINKYELTPIKDEAAKPVLEVSNAVALEILKGATISKAVEASKVKASKEILKLVLSEEPYARASLRALIQNNGCLEFKGNAETAI